MRPLIAVLALSTVVAACAAENHGSATVSAPVRAFLEANCRLRDRCGDEAYETCMKGRLTSCERAWAELAHSDLPTVDECVRALKEVACQERQVTIASCDTAGRVLYPHLTVGTVSAVGGPCGGATTCVDEGFCSGADSSSCGVCKTRLRAGESCLGGNVCQGFCRAETGLCEDRNAPGGSCELDSQCQMQSFCQDGLCTRLDVGDPCQESCGEQLLCLDGVCAERRGEGEPCAGDECALPFLCSEGMCVLPPECGTAAAGDDCFGDEGCVRGLICDEQKHACTKPVVRKRGQACGGPTQRCEPGTSCGFSVCETMRGVGAKCDQDEDCLTGMVCDEGRCRWDDASCGP